MAMAEKQKTWSQTRVEDTLGVLYRMHADVYKGIIQRIKHLGRKVNDTKIRDRGDGIAEEVLDKFRSQTEHGYSREIRSGNPEKDNPDNVKVLLGQMACEVRWNAWLERMEIRGGDWKDWIKIDDTVVAKLMTRAKKTGSRFVCGKDFLWDTLLTLAHETTVDPVLDVIAELQVAWDGQPRLSIWLSAVCGVPADPYHQAVSRNIIGGMVKRIRQPGCKHDEIAIFHGQQETYKSTLAAIIADMGQSSIAQIRKASAAWFSDEVMFGDASKELVLSLAGKCVVEVAEMGMRGSANANHVKAMLSRQVDRGRTAYARTVSERPRRNIFVGTTNDDEPLTDPTGNRRFLPVHVAYELNLEWLQANIGQLVGEAAVREAAGETFALPREVREDAKAYQEAARSESDAEIRLAEWFEETPITAVAYITAADLVELSSIATLRGNDSARSKVMKTLGFRRERPYIDGKRARIWFRGPAKLAKHIQPQAVRYIVGKTTDGRPRVTIRTGDVAAPSIVPE
jgi:predicted P-loop ATPase